jgi:hypothetical protein
MLRSIRPTRARRPFDASLDPTDARNQPGHLDQNWRQAFSGRMIPLITPRRRLLSDRRRLPTSCHVIASNSFDLGVRAGGVGWPNRKSTSTGW